MGIVIRLIIGALGLVAFGAPVYAQDMSGWTDKTICRLISEQSTNQKIYIDEAIQRGLDCLPPILHAAGHGGEFIRSMNIKPHGYAVIKDFTGKAPNAFIEKFEVRPGDCHTIPEWSDCKNDRERSELSGPENNYINTEFWYGWSLYIPEDYPNVYPTSTALGQFHHHRHDNPAFMFKNGDGLINGGYWVSREFEGTTNSMQLLSEEEFKGKWHHIEIHAKWHDTNGFFIVYVNGVKKWHFAGETIYAKHPIYFKYGIYRSFVSRYKNLNDVDEVPSQTAYYANVKRGKNRESLVGDRKPIFESKGSEEVDKVEIVTHKPFVIVIRAPGERTSFFNYFPDYEADD